MAQIIPVQAVPAQTFGVTLGTQPVQITLRQLSTGLYIQVVLDGEEIVGLVVCQDLNRIIRNAYLGFSGDLAFYDTTGAGDDPTFDGLGDRYLLFWLEPGDVPANA